MDFLCPGSLTEYLERYEAVIKSLTTRFFVGWPADNGWQISLASADKSLQFTPICFAMLCQIFSSCGVTQINWVVDRNGGKQSAAPNPRPGLMINFSSSIRNMSGGSFSFHFIDWSKHYHLFCPHRRDLSQLSTLSTIDQNCEPRQQNRCSSDRETKTLLLLSSSLVGIKYNL